MHKTEHPGLNRFYEMLRRPGITRDPNGKWFAGVATGLSNRLGVDPLIVRAGFILLTLLFGAGVVIYLTCWLLIPARDGSIMLERALKYGDGGAIFLLVVTVISVFSSVPFVGNDGPRWSGITLLPVGLAAWWFFTRTDVGRGIYSDTKAKMSTPGETGATADPHGTYGTDSAASGPSSQGTEHQSASYTSNPQAHPWSSPATEGRTWAPSAPETPARPRRRGVGFLASLVILGAGLAAGAGLYEASRVGNWAGNSLAYGFAAALAVFGLGAIVAGALGRRTGWLGLFATVAVFGGFTSLIVPATLTQPFTAGERSYAPTSLGRETTYQIGAGDLTVDLSNVSFDQDPTTSQRVNVALGLGDMQIMVPDKGSVQVITSARMGELKLEGNTPNAGRITENGVNLDRTVTYGTATGAPDLIIDARSGAGTITVTKG